VFSCGNVTILETQLNYPHEEKVMNTPMTFVMLQTWFKWLAVWWKFQ